MRLLREKGRQNKFSPAAFMSSSSSSSSLACLHFRLIELSQSSSPSSGSFSFALINSTHTSPMVSRWTRKSRLYYLHPCYSRRALYGDTALRRNDHHMYLLFIAERASAQVKFRCYLLNLDGFRLFSNEVEQEQREREARFVLPSLVDCASSRGENEAQSLMPS